MGIEHYGITHYETRHLPPPPPLAPAPPICPIVLILCWMKKKRTVLQ